MTAGILLLRMLGLCLLAGVLLAGMLFPAVGGLGLASNQASDTVDAVSNELVEGRVPVVSTVTDAAGTPIAHVFDQNRILVGPEGIADTMKAAIIAIEDRRFFEHDGVDWKGVTRAALTNQLAGETAQGASTIDMQYVKNYLLFVVAKNDADRLAATEVTPARKLREIRIALQLERQLSKQEILARYLNVVFFGNNSYGVHAAARTYFNTTPDQLTISQAALLAGVVKNPSANDPIDNPQGALNRRNLVIDAMRDVGSITPEAAEAAKAEPLGIVRPLNTLPNGCVSAGVVDGFYCAYTLRYLERIGLPQEEIRRGGYLIRTNLDRRVSDIAKEAAEAQVPKDTEGIANTMAIVQPGRDKHRVRALVANRDFGFDAEAGQTAYELPSAVTPFGAGSIYKTFTAAAALEKGLGIQTTIPVPGTYTSKKFKDNTGPYTVENAGRYPGSMTLQKALSTSPNTAFVALEERVGVPAVVDMAYRLGLRQGMAEVNMAARPPDPNAESTDLRLPQGEHMKVNNIGSFTLGPGPTSTLELANVTATLMSAGTWCPPTPIDAVFDRDGNPVPLREPPCEQVVPEGLANTQVIGMSQDAAPGGTAAAAASAYGWNRPFLGKTGTTQQNKSAGFLGATPQYAGAVLVFADGNNPRPICDTDPPRLCGNGNIFGGKVPARTWFEAMTRLLEGQPVLPLPPTDPRYVEGGGSVRVPMVIGRSASQGQQIVEAAGFRVQLAPEASTERRGIIVNQAPTGTAIEGDLVTLFVSSGEPPDPGPPADQPADQPADDVGPGFREGGGGGAPPPPPPAPPPPPPAPDPPPDNGGGVDADGDGDGDGDGGYQPGPPNDSSTPGDGGQQSGEGGQEPGAGGAGSTPE